MPIKRGNMSDAEAQGQLALVKLHDEIKNRFCEINNIPLIRIPYWEQHNLESFLFTQLNKLGVIAA
jgi:hypothetical protein